MRAASLLCLYRQTERLDERLVAALSAEKILIWAMGRFLIFLGSFFTGFVEKGQSSCGDLMVRSWWFGWWMWSLEWASSGAKKYATIFEFIFGLV
jgi:hypothetical protein